METKAKTYYNQKAVYQYDLDGNFIQKFDSVWGATRALRESICPTAHQSNISTVLDSYKRTMYGFKWRSKPLMQKNRNRRKVCQFTMDGEFVAEHESITDAALAVGTYPAVIMYVCQGKWKHTQGFIWKYKENCK